MQEQRRHVRVASPVMLKFPNPDTMKTERSYTQDISESGMRFPTAVKLSIGQELAMTMELPFREATMHATGEVMWIREVSRLGSPQYEVGVRFRWIQDPDRQCLARHLAGLFTRRV